ncbi:hypothetical protein [Sphingobium sp. B8D3C]|uniref:hypothetical protein n=1 Tax=Sphingobium sp. B8D3C TaxID=2940586 RepID=UPI0022247E4F|nr:hypothetical protein [Sphingobium sp. B8D3C]MCW2419371.1 hypothetical protein [Sphingobium sp. B8D3C]
MADLVPCMREHDLLAAAQQDADRQTRRERWSQITAAMAPTFELINKMLTRP